MTFPLQIIFEIRKFIEKYHLSDFAYVHLGQRYGWGAVGYILDCLKFCSSKFFGVYFKVARRRMSVARYTVSFALRQINGHSKGTNNAKTGIHVLDWILIFQMHNTNEEMKDIRQFESRNPTTKSHNFRGHL